ncbi:hypothetical protein RUM43_013819 [Polyplax serrata]|uniref:Leucine-rich repeat-containing protein 34 n=1 Tax=Polyplax serrata TaxID=468196 RepID=A0AAN8P4P6_POLSC
MSICLQDFIFTDLFMEMQCDRNHDGTRNLILRGNDLMKKIGKRINDRDLIKITAFLRNHPEIVALDLPYNEISDCGMSTLANFFKERPIIRYINLMCNNIGPRGIKYFVDLGDIFPLHAFRLTGNNIGDEGGKLLSKLLSTETPLKFLDIMDTHQTITGLAHLITSMMKSRGGAETLKYIDIGRPLPQPYHKVPNTNIAELVCQLISCNTHLEEIHLQQCQFDFRDMEILADGLNANKNLVCLDLNNNNIGDDGVEFLCQYLKKSPQLECLMIGANNFGNSGAKALSFNLPFSKIKLLDITNNLITDEGMINIFYTVRKKVTLRALFIWGNKLSQASLVVLQRLFQSKLLDPQHTDIKLYCSDQQLKAAWNPQANRYNHRFYCVSDYGHPPLRQILRIPQPPMDPPDIKYRHHAGAIEMGLPSADWKYDWLETKYSDPF